jgi:hypothetical protein
MPDLSFNGISKNERTKLLQWLNKQDALTSMSEKELLLVLLFRLNALQTSIDEIQKNTKTHWVNSDHS